MPAERVVAAMETGSMITMANGRSAAERQAIAEFLTGRSLSNPVVTIPASSAMCSAGSTPFNASAGPRWAGWGQNTSNTRFQDAAAAGLTATDIPRLKLKWAFAFPGDLQSYAQSSMSVDVSSWAAGVARCIH
jgi:polyvinyl alcohol dehydrogenase (cytochrome)